MCRVHTIRGVCHQMSHFAHDEIELYGLEEYGVGTRAPYPVQLEWTGFGRNDQDRHRMRGRIPAEDFAEREPVDERQAQFGEDDSGRLG